MDILTGLTAASQAIGLVKQLRDFDKAIDEAVFKGKLIELQEAVLDARSSLLEAKQSALEKDERIAELELLLKTATSGDTCPICNTGALKVVAVRPDPTFGELGVKERSMKCSNPECGHTENRMHDPMQILKP